MHPSFNRSYVRDPHGYYNPPPYAEPYRPGYQPPPSHYGPVWSNTQEPVHPSNVPPSFQAHQNFKRAPFQNDPVVPGVKKAEKTEKSTVNNNGLFQNITHQWYDNWYLTWIKEELNFSMNKISMAGLLFGLMFLGSIFFLIGFLVAVNLYGGKQDQLLQDQQRSLIPSYSAQLSGRMGNPMNANLTNGNYAAMRQNLTQGPRMPSSFQQQTNQQISMAKSRVPSFQVSSPSMPNTSFSTQNYR